MHKSWTAGCCMVESILRQRFASNQDLIPLASNFARIDNAVFKKRTSLVQLVSCH
jgi:hypothetical protein